MEKLKGRPIFNPADFRAYLAERRGVKTSEIASPEDVIFTYDQRIFQSAIAQTAASPVGWYIYSGNSYLGAIGGKPVGVIHALIGAAAAAMNLEELISYGAKRVYELGLAGAIDTKLGPGDLVVLRGAFSDEGTSRHYFRGSERFGSSRALTKLASESLRAKDLEYELGDAWTTDAPYRETVAKVARFRRKGARVVNMESSAIFAVASYRRIEAASVQIVSDVVSERKWSPAFHKDIVNVRREEALSAILQSIGV
ncbi:MAG: nucleoside phosphorylase [Thaumarchaeota archaeon]|nr:nucleoside phosphorylase [Nitrososphaerota archaeon]